MQNMDCTVTIGGTDYSSDIVSIERRHVLCTPGQIFILNLNPDQAYSGILPYQAVTIYEQGTLVLTGYVSSIVIGRPPRSVVVNGQDTYKLCLETFIPDDVYTNGETILYWVDYLCTLAGVSYSIEGDGSNLYVLEDVKLGLRTVAEALNAIVNYAGWVITVDTDGTIRFVNIGTATDWTFYTLKGIRTIGDENARNAAIVWGLEGVRHTEYRAVTGTGSGRTMVLSAPFIVTDEQAAIIAEYLLNQWANLDDIMSMNILGDPTIKVGQVAALDFNGSYTGVITDLRSYLDQGGYRMDLVMGRKCLSMAAVTPVSTLVYAGTEHYGARSYNFYTSGSPTWLNVIPTSGSFDSMEAFALDYYVPTTTAYVSGSFGIARSINLHTTSPDFSIVHSRSQFQTATGKSLWAVTNLSSVSYRGLVYAQAVSTDGTTMVGRSTDSGVSWTWSGAIDVITSGSNPISSLPILGFATRGSQEIWTAGNSGSLMYCSTGSSSLNFTNTYTVPYATTPIRAVQAPTGEVFIGGGSWYLPYFSGIYTQDNYSSSTGVNNPSNIYNAPDFQYATFTGLGSILHYTDVPYGAVNSSGSYKFRFYANTSGSAVVRVDPANSLFTFTDVYLSGVQRPTDWFYVSSLYANRQFTLQNVSSGSFAIDALEFPKPEVAVQYRNGLLTQGAIPYSSGTWTGDGEWTWGANDYDSSATFFLDNVWVGASVEVSVTCVYEPVAIPTPPYYCYVIDISSNSYFDASDTAMQNGETRVFPKNPLVDGSLGFQFFQGLSRSGSYQINYIIVDGVVVFQHNNPSPSGYVKVSTSGSFFTDITPSAGGAINLRSLASVNNNPNAVFALTSSGSVAGSLTSGSTWPLKTGWYSAPSNIVANPLNYQRVYWLGDTGIYYSGNSFTTVSVKTGNWQSVYGVSFYDSGTKKFLVPNSVI